MKRRAEIGLTLLEVMAAVALLGILYAYLARAASQGILTSGDSRWRLEASLRADQAMADLEQEMRAQAPLEVGTTEVEEELFTVTREVETWSLPLEPPPEAEQAPAPALSLLGGDPRNPGLLRRVSIRVSWFDGLDEHSLERVTFALDLAAAESLLGGGAAPGEAELQNLLQRSGGGLQPPATGPGGT